MKANHGLWIVVVSVPMALLGAGTTRAQTSQSVSQSTAAITVPSTGEDRAHLNLRVTRWGDSVLGAEQSAPPPRRRDSVLNGLLIGAGVGAVVGLIPDHYDDCEECHDSLYASIAVGAGVGLLVDVLRGQSTASRSSRRQTSLRLDVGPPSARVRIAGIVRWR